MNNNDRFKKAEKAIIFGVMGDILLAIIKWVIGVQSNSRALIANAVHSALIINAYDDRSETMYLHLSQP